MIRAALERAISPGLGTCYRCNRPWKHPATRARWHPPADEWKLLKLPRRGATRVRFQLNRQRFYGLVGVDPHHIEYDQGRSCFPLCAGCWHDTDVLQRVAYCERLCNDWLRDGLIYGFGDTYIADTERKRPLIRAAVLADL